MNYGGYLLARRLEFYAVITIIFSFFLPPLGFGLAFIRFMENRAMKLSCAGWISLMVISSIMSVLFLAMLIGSCSSGGSFDSESVESLLIII